ncbi:MAG: hypothetical protein IJ759_02455 [Bacteroidales bacterium]|nr:hypothetical protein [Bacteroidales bacterium]
MQTLTVESRQTEIIRGILSIRDTKYLKRLQSSVNKKLQSYSTITEDEEPTKDEVMQGIKEALEVAKLAKQGKIKSRPLDELLDEI